MSQTRGRLPTDLLPISRRQMLQNTGAGFGALALSGILGAQTFANDPLDIQVKLGPHHPQKAKSIIFLFMEGGPSSIDTFDPKPLLTELAGKKLPSSFKPVILPMGEHDSPLLASKRKFSQYGEGGLWMSDWLPHLSECADDLCVVRSLWGNGLNHSGGVCQMNTGSILAGRPSLGSWITYGLGTENSNLPAYVVMEDNPGQVTNGTRNWSAGFMPAVHQATPFQSGNEPIRNLLTPAEISADRQRDKLQLINQLNRIHAEDRPQQSELEARIRSYELAFRMQAEAPEAINIEEETAETQALYGIDQKETATYGRMCLLARRLVERGVRFVQLYHGSGSKWDAHKGLEGNHTPLFRSSDKPIAGLLKDLKRRGLLDETLVIWGGEFGRTPMSEKGDGRDHNPYGFSMWLAGGGVRGGRTVGATDELGLHAVEDRLHIHDFHATILRLMGLDHMQLVYRYQGRPERATLNEGTPCEKILL